MDSFFHPEAKKLVSTAVASVEKKTSVEVVVLVHKIAGDYRHTSYIGGLVFATAFLCLFLYYPEPFDYTYLPLEQLAAFGFGALLTSVLDPVRRLLVGARQKQQAVRAAAREAFVDLKIGKTRFRNGVLVYVAAFERCAEVVCDVGIDAVTIGAPLADAIKKIERSVRLDRDPERFAEAVASLGPALAAAFPRAHDDENELADELASKTEETHEDGEPDEDEEEAR